MEVVKLLLGLLMLELRVEKASVPSWSSSMLAGLLGRTTESDGGHFPSHPGRQGPETSSEGAHLTPNPQEIQAGFTLRNPSPASHSIPPSIPSIPPIPPCFSSQAQNLRKFKASVRARANPEAVFPRARADEILFFARKNDRGRGRKNTK